MSNSPTPDPWKKNMAPATSYSAHIRARPQPAEAMSNIQTPVLMDDNEGVEISINGHELYFRAQDAYDLHQAIGSILPQLVQPFKPWPRPRDEVKP